MKQGYWMIRTYECGAIGEKTKFFVPGDPSRRSAAKEKTAAKKALQNEYSCVKNLTRILNLNYKGGDLLVGLDYSDEGLRMLGDGDEDAVLEAARHEVSLFLRRVKREMKKQGMELYSVAVTSDMDGDTGEAVRVHHHLVLNGEAAEIVMKKWKHGNVDVKKLRAQNDYKKLAEYLLSQVRKIPDEKKYICSQNLERPVPHDRVAVSASQMRAPKGATLLYANAFIAGQAQYIRYVLPKEKVKKAKRNLSRRRNKKCVR